MWCWAGKPVSITHCSQLQRAGGAQGGFLSGMTGAAKWGDFLICSFSDIIFRRAWFASRYFPEAGKCQGVCTH